MSDNSHLSNWISCNGNCGGKYCCQFRISICTMWLESNNNRTRNFGIGIVSGCCLHIAFLGSFGRHMGKAKSAICRNIGRFLIFTYFGFCHKYDCFNFTSFYRRKFVSLFLYSYYCSIEANKLLFSLFNSLAGTQAGAYPYISEFHTYKKASIAAAMVSIFLNCDLIHLALSAIVILPMDWTIEFYPFEFKPWRLFLVINSLLNLWNAIVFYYLPESPKFLLTMNRKDEALDILSRIYAINTGNDKKVRIDKNNLRYPLCMCNVQ